MKVNGKVMVLICLGLPLVAIVGWYMLMSS